MIVFYPQTSVEGPVSFGWRGFSMQRLKLMTSDRDTVVASALARVMAIGATLLLTSCNPPAAQQGDQSPRIQQLERDLASRDAEVAALKELLLEERLKPEVQAAPAEAAKAIGDRTLMNEAEAIPGIAPTSSRYPHMCYKDYCPCTGPQGGPDEVLCGQLEQGQEPALELMVTGRKLREERRKTTDGRR
jgi:hypothetical protein